MRYALVLGAAALAVIALTQIGSTPATPPAPAPSVAAAAKVMPVRPRLPPRPGDAPPPAMDEPILPTATPEQRADIAERARGAARPGMTAFRAFSDLYVDGNLDLARRQAESEGLTLDQVRDLTSFGLMVLATQRVSDVEEIVGRSLTEEQRETLSALMISANGEFKEKLRALVAAGASEAERWKLIRSTQSEYLIDFYAATGMNDDLLDDLLAGNVNLPGAPASTQPPEGPVPPASPVDTDLHPERPR